MIVAIVRHCPRLAALGIFACAVAYQCQTAAASAPDLYQALAHRVESGEIRIEYELSDKPVALAGVRIRGSSNASATMFAKLEKTGYSTAKITFSPRLTVKAGRGSELQVSSIIFSGSGAVTAVSALNAAGAAAVLDEDLRKKLFSALRIEKTTARLLGGRLFTRARARCPDPWKACTDTGRFVRTIRWSSGGGTVGVAPGPLAFAPADTESCAELDAKATSMTTVLEASYDPMGRWAVVRAAMGSVVIGGGCLGLDRTKLRLALKGGSAMLKELTALRTAATDSVKVHLVSGDVAFGRSDVQLAQDSKLQANVALTAGTLTLGNDGVRIDIDADRPLSIALGADAVIKMEVDRGMLGLWSDSFTRLGSGTITMPLTTAVWTTGRVPLVVADHGAVAFDLQLIVGGVMKPTAESRLPIVGGRLTATKASFDSQAGARFFGTFARSTFRAAAGSRFMAPGGFVVNGFTADTDVRLEDATEPLTLDRVAVYPSGRFTFSGDANLVSSASDQALSCDLGSYSVDVFLAPPSFVLRGPLRCKGQYQLNAVGNALTVSVDLVVQQLGLSLPSGVVSGKGTFAVTTPQGTKVSFKTEGKREAKQVKNEGPLKSMTPEAKAVTLQIETRKTLTLSAPFQISGGLVDFKPADQTIPVAVTLPHKQEVLSVDLELETDVVDLLPDCTYHIAAEAGTYDTSVTLGVGIDRSVATASINGLSEFKPSIGHDEWGCELTKALVAVILGGLTGLVGGTTVGTSVAVGSAIAIELVEDALIDAAIRRKVAEFSHTLPKRELPPLLVPLQAD